MSRQVYTYTDLKKINKSKNFNDLIKFPQITVSADLRKCLNGNAQIDHVEGVISQDTGFRVTEFRSLAKEINEDWNTDISKFNEIVLLSNFMRDKIKLAKDDAEKLWLQGCLRNLDSILSAIILLEQADVKPEDMRPAKDKNLKLLLEAWEDLLSRDKSLIDFKKRMEQLTSREMWAPIIKSVFDINTIDTVDTLVFHGFYYITPYQERIMRLLEKAGFKLIFLIPYDERYPYVYEIWDESYTPERGFVDKKDWVIEKSDDDDPFGAIFEGNQVEIRNRVNIKEYASVMEFVDDVKHVREKGFSIYSSDFKNANDMLKEYFPEAFGDRKILSYPIGQFINALNNMWDDVENDIVLDDDNLIECFSSGWLSVDGIAGKEFIHDLMNIIPFFNGCKRIGDWEKRIKLFKEIEESVIKPFENDLDPDPIVSRWQEAIGSPLKNFSMFSVNPNKLDVILKLIKQLLDMARELFVKDEMIKLHDHIRKLGGILKRHKISDELYSEEKEIINNIFELFGTDNGFDTMCHPADIARALDIYMCGRFEEGEIQTNKVGLVYPLYFVDAACIKNKSKVHICMSDVENLPGGNKDYIWPLTGRNIKEVLKNTNNALIYNLIQIMESNTLCNRFFTYCALKNEDVTISWISNVGEKQLAPSPYIKLLMNIPNVVISPAFRNSITYKRVGETSVGNKKILDYDNDKMPIGIIKEAEMDYALCPMKYVLGYVVDKYPTYQSDFQMSYAINALISSIYSLMKSDGVTLDEAYESIVSLFPLLRKVEKRQVKDYLSYDRRENDIDYSHRTECGGKYYTDERLKIHYPNQEVRTAAIAEYGKLRTPDRRMGMNLYEMMEVPDVCVFCQHESYCRNALYSGDQENYYD